MDTNAQFLRYTWLSAQLVQMVTRSSWLCDWCARETITMHRKCFTVNTLRNFKRHRLLHQGLFNKSGTYFCTQVSSSWIYINIQYYITVLWECQTSTASGKFCRVCGGRAQKKPKTVDQYINTTHTRKHYWLLMALMLFQMTHPSIHNASVIRAM